MHLTLWYVVLVCHQYDACKDYVGNVYVYGTVACVACVYAEGVRVAGRGLD